jgi:outer membrane biosynthesis protein TonB
MNKIDVRTPTVIFASVMTSAVVMLLVFNGGSDSQRIADVDEATTTTEAPLPLAEPAAPVVVTEELAPTAPAPAPAPTTTVAPAPTTTAAPAPAPQSEPEPEPEPEPSAVTTTSLYYGDPDPDNGP